MLQQPLHLQQNVQIQLQQDMQQYLQFTSDTDLTSQVMSQQPYQDPLQVNMSIPIAIPAPVPASMSPLPSQSPSPAPPSPTSSAPSPASVYSPSTVTTTQSHIAIPKVEQQVTYDIEVNSRKTQKRTYQDDTTSNKNVSVDGSGNLFLQGKVGINTVPTEEALTVHGNVLVTGNYLKPSDQRVKKNITKKDYKTQLENIENIQLYEYDLKHEIDSDGEHVHETGVLAQELRKVLPTAVQVLQNVTLADGTIMPELLVVQDRALLYETIGATKELGAGMRENQEHLSVMHKRSTDLKHATHRAFTALGKSLDYLLTEAGDDTRDDIAASACYCTLFGLGPAWTAYFLGFLFPPLWLCGVFYISSFQRVKKLAGFFSAVTLILYIGYISLIFSAPREKVGLFLAPAMVAVLGLILLCGPIAISWGQKKARRRYYKFTKKKKAKAKLRKELGEVSDALEEV